MKQERYFLAGSDWLYYKLYMGPQTSEQYLISKLSPIIDEFFKNDFIDKWFFINYNDYGRHLRVRFHIKNRNKNLMHIINGMNSSLSNYISERLINNVQIGLYKREVERYGYSTINEFESLFHLNSILIINILKLIGDDQNLRWLWCIKAIDSFMDDWNFSLKSRKIFFESLKDSFGMEMGITKAIKKQLSQKYRENFQQINNIIQVGSPLLNNILKEHQEKSKPFINYILDEKRNGALKDFTGAYESYIHMHCNRIFNSRQRLNEWVVYDLLHQYYRSLYARTNNK